MKPTLVNTGSPSPRVPESKHLLGVEKVDDNVEGERQRGALVHSLRSQSIMTWPEQQRLGIF